MEKLFILIIEGTARPKRLSINAAKLVEKVGQTFEEIDVQLIKPEDFNLPFDGNDKGFFDQKYKDLTAKADAFFIVTPEYNHSFPGSLKRLLDSEFKNYNHKPVAFAGVSDGQWGGVRAIEALLPSMRTMKLIALKQDVQFPFVQNIFEENGELKDEKYIERVTRVYRELIWYAKTLKYGRENIN